MRVIVMVKETERSEAGAPPSQQLIDDMGRFNQELIDAGIMIAAEGLQPTRKGKRLVFTGPSAKTTVVDGPFAEAKELVGGFWIWQVESMDEAMAWAAKMPCPHELLDGEEAIVELRQIAEPEDFGDMMSPELVQMEKDIRAEADRKLAP